MLDGGGLELKLIQTCMIQKQLLWVEVGKALESRTQMEVDRRHRAKLQGTPEKKKNRKAGREIPAI